MPFIPNRWLILRLRFSGPFVRCQYSDSLGRARRLAWDWRVLPPLGIWPPPAGTEPFFEFSDLANSILKGLPTTRWGTDPNDKAPLAVFVDVPVDLLTPDLEEQFFAWPGFNPDRIQVVQLSRGKSIQRPPFQLPLNVLAVGEQSPLALSRLEESSWYVNFAEVREFGLRINTAKEFSRTELSKNASDVLIAEADPLVFAGLRDLPEALRPRLVIVLDKNFQRPLDVQVPTGIAVLRLPDVSFGPNVAKFIRSFTYGILHDFPLHEAVKSAFLEISPLFKPLLIADPMSNQGLRIVDALSAIRRQNEKLEVTLPELDFDAFFSRLTNLSDPHLQKRLPALQNRVYGLTPTWKTMLSQMRSRASNARSLPAYFTHESDSLVPMANFNAEFAQLVSQQPSVHEVVEQIVGDTDMAELLRAHQQRFVDVALARLQTEPVLEPLTRFESLQKDRSYQLRVHVGNRLPDSLVVGPTPPLDPILPETQDTRGHLLEIAVQGKDFDVKSEPTKAVWLPEFGATEPVYFEVRSPNEGGWKQLRVCVYCKNYLIQAYQLCAEITETELKRTEPGTESLTVKLEFSRTNKFSDLEEFHPRLLSIGANSGGNGATHELIVKGDQASGEITLFPGTYDPQVKQFRDTLEKASKDPNNPKLTRVYPAVAPGQSPGKDVAQTFRDLVRHGRELYDAVFGKAARTGLRSALVKIAKGANEKLQVVRFDDNFVFPWVILYDFLLPDEIYGQNPSPICLGVVADATGNAVPCNHTYKDKVYCVNGFWGVRHYVEELIGQGTSTNPKITKTSAAAIRIVADTSLIPAAQLIHNLDLSFGSTQVIPGPVDPDQLLDLLWADPPQRPSILIVLGHLATTAKAGEPEGARIVLVPKSKWLLRKKISERSGMDSVGWCQPRSLVFLMACESAATEVETVNDFVTAWNTAGAGAIIGTECIVGADLAASLAEEVTTSLWNGTTTLGEAMTSFRRKEVNRGNPLALVFHAVGDVDLTVN